MDGHFQNNLPGDRLLMHIQDIEALEEQKQEINEGIKDRYNRAKGDGFDGPIVKRIIERRKLRRKLGPKRVEELDALLNIYEVAIGDRSDLSEAAKKRFEREWIAREMKRKADEENPDKQADLEDLIDKLAEQQEPEATEEAVKKATEEGLEAAKAGKSIRDNPYTKEGPLRAAWDMGWCQGAGSDGMDIPEAFKRRKPKPDAEKDEKPDGEEPEATGGKPDTDQDGGDQPDGDDPDDNDQDLD